VSPKIGAVVKLGDVFRVFASYAQGFRAPEPGQINQFFVNLAQGYTSISNPNLRPETSASTEVGLRVNTKAIDASFSVFQADYEDFISQEIVRGAFTPANPAVFQFINLTRVRVKGAEARLEGRPGAGFTGSLAVSYAQGDQISPTSARTPLSTIDPLKIVGGVGWR